MPPRPESASARPRPRLRLPNTRTGAIAVAAAIGLLGFVLGGLFLIVVPLARSGQGVFALLKRDVARPAGDLRPRSAWQSSAATPVNERPELWQTPTATAFFPSAEGFADLAPRGGAVAVLYDPARSQRIVASPPIRDALGRPVASVVVGLAADADAATPGPLRPDDVEPTSLTIAASAAGTEEASGCTLAIRESGMQVTGAFGAANPEGCRGGTITLPTQGSLGFALSYDRLPNRRSRDGAWREGGVFGRTEIRLALKAPRQD